MSYETAPALTISTAIELARELDGDGVTVKVEVYDDMVPVVDYDGAKGWKVVDYALLTISWGGGSASLDLAKTTEQGVRAKVAECVASACESATAEAPPAPAGKLEVAPMTIRAAKAYITTHHRHHRAPVSGLFAVGVRKAGELVGVLIVGRPVARMTAQDPHTVEATRCATDGSKNAISMLYSAAWRAARALGYRRLITYTLPEEGGASMRASGFVCVGQAGGGSWSRKGRERADTHPTQTKLRWEVTTEKTIVRAA